MYLWWILHNVYKPEFLLHTLMAQITSDGKVLITYKTDGRIYYTNGEYADINFVYGFGDGYARVASTEYQRRYSDRRQQACAQRHNTVRRKQVHSCQQNTLAAADAMCSIRRVSRVHSAGLSDVRELLKISYWETVWQFPAG
jgi:hypothetical protein